MSSAHAEPVRASGTARLRRAAGSHVGASPELPLMRRRQPSTRPTPWRTDAGKPGQERFIESRAWVYGQAAHAPFYWIPGNHDL